MKRGIRVQDGEDLSDLKLREVISKLEQEKPITKKEACEMLNISYNTTRLNRIIEEYKERVEYNEKRRKELRNQPLTDVELTDIVTSYLEEGNISSISASTFRSSAVIKRVLNRFNIPLRSAANTYRNPIFLSDDAIAEDYKSKDLVYSARYDQPAYIISERDKQKGVYAIWLIKDEQYAHQPYWELGDLRKLQAELKVEIETRKFWDDPNLEMQRAIAEAIHNSRKGKKVNE